MKLPCIAFKLPPLSPSRTSLGRVYRMEPSVFGMVEIKTKQDPSRLNSLYLVRPWLDVLLDREDTGTFVEDDVAEPSSPGMDDDDISDEEIEDNSPPFSEHITPYAYGPHGQRDTRVTADRSSSSAIRCTLVNADVDTSTLCGTCRFRRMYRWPISSTMCAYWTCCSLPVSSYADRCLLRSTFT